MMMTMAERVGFEPTVRGYRTYDFQSYTFDQLGHLSRHFHIRSDI